LVWHSYNVSRGGTLRWDLFELIYVKRTEKNLRNTGSKLQKHHVLTQNNSPTKKIKSGKIFVAAFIEVFVLFIHISSEKSSSLPQLLSKFFSSLRQQQKVNNVKL
jgi:hypothetical protein